MTAPAVRFHRLTRPWGTVWSWDAPDGTAWFARPEADPVTGDGNARRYGWAILQADRTAGFVLVGNAATLAEARRQLADPGWRARHALHDPAVAR